MEHVDARAVSSSDTVSPKPSSARSAVASHRTPAARHGGHRVFFILFFGALYLAASFVLPVVFALLFMLVLSPVVRFAKRNGHVVAGLPMPAVFWPSSSTSSPISSGSVWSASWVWRTAGH